MRRPRSAAGRNRIGPQAEGPRGSYALLLLAVVAFILYGSLYPLVYYSRTYPGGPVAYLLSTWTDWDHRGDLLSNILLYIPFGFFAVLSLPSRWRGPLRASLATVAGILLAGCVEVAQFHDRSRVTSMGDVYANGIGALLGAIAATIIGSRRWPLLAELARSPRPAMLLALWAGYRLYPYVPTIDLHKYWHTVRPLLHLSHLPAAETARFVVIWLLITCLVHALYGFRRWLLLFPLLALAEFAARILIISTDLKLADIGGAAGAFLVWLVLHRLPGRHLLLAICLGALVVWLRLAPFHFEPVGRPFSWVPFGSMMHGSIGIAMQAFCEKATLYGGLIWLLHRAGTRLGTATAITAVLLLATSFAETHLPGRSAEITDAVMALALGGAFALLPDPADRAAPAPSGRPRAAG
ncbi:MAG TPA: VanZ family protein [Acetobacteraceae bacterium]|nr:VanZ family protein [Acetobacteraceae bacterium]